MQPLELVKLKDVVIEFTQAEWVMLDSSQRRLFRDVMLENISNMFSVGYQVCESDVASKLVQGEELCEEGIGFFQNQNSVLSGREDSVKEQEMLSVHHVCKKDLSTIISLKQNSHTEKNGIICSKLPEDCTHGSRVFQHVLTHKEMKSYINNLFGKALNDL
ncbi:zinc finger protein 705A-like isoform X1 [Tamandua tetradactyla]|uniref:zinc finger protein 705A-like isoform X1 n=1 Tax=Tamandua tetradactyla TaxID=48850 RepID=UPI0040544E74